MTHTHNIPEPPAPESAQRSVWRRALWPIATVVALLVGVGIGSTGGDTEAGDSAALQDEADTDTSGADEAAQTTTADDKPADDTDSAGEAGSRDNPYTIGDMVGGDDWEMTLGQPYEAWDEIKAENEFNEPPADGMEYYIVPVSVTYVGDETGLPWSDLFFEFVGDDNRTYGDFCEGVIPDDLSEVDELYADGAAEGNVCIPVPEGAAGLWTVSTFMGDPVFFDAS